MESEVKREMVERVGSLRESILIRYSTLNLEAVWLFVATLGCWSVDQPHIQFIALILVFIFFASKVSRDSKNNKSFLRVANEIRADIEISNLEGDAEKARLYELDEIEKNLLGLKSIYKSASSFLMGYGFWAISFLTFGYRFWLAS